MNEMPSHVHPSQAGVFQWHLSVPAFGRKFARDDVKHIHPFSNRMVMQ